MGLVHFTADNFEAEVLKSEIPVLVDFFAEWCGPCKMIAPVVEELAKQYEGKVKIGKLDVDEAQDIAGEYGVMSIPMLIFFKGGEPVEQLMGAVPKEDIEAQLKQL